MELGALVKLQGFELDNAVLLRAEGDMDAFIDGEAGDLAELMIAVRA